MVFDRQKNIIAMKELSYWDKYLEIKTPIVLQAGAEWRSPCKFLKPVLQKIQGEFGEKIKFVFMDIEKFPEIAEMLDISHILKYF